MRQIRNEKELVGQTINRIAWADDDRLFLFFIDDSFCIIGDGEYSVTVSEHTYKTSPVKDNIDELLGLGFIDQALYHKTLTECNIREGEKQKRKDLLKLDKLRAQLRELNEKYPENN